MPCRINPVDRISRAIRVRIHATLAKRAQAVRAVEAHQHRVVGAITVAKQVITGERVALFAVETGHSIEGLGSVMVTVRRVGNVRLVSVFTRMQNAIVQIAGDHHCHDLIALPTLLREQLAASADAGSLPAAL